MAKRFKLSAIQSLAFGFAAIILIGALLLMLPYANRDGESIRFVDALFTATSATCVTGLIVFDTYTQFTLFGQIVILLLIQTGGLGFMTIAMMFSLLFGRRIGLKSRSYLMEAVNSTQIGGIVRLAKGILIGTVFFELTGAVLLSIRFIPMFGAARGIWYGIFHSVSAFCNAGFDLMGCLGQYSSLTHFADDKLVSIVIMSLIVVGGIGFMVWDDIAKNKWHWKKYRLHTKIMICGTALLIIIPAALFYIMESNASYAGMTTSNKIVASLFQSITPRTAGFNTTDYTKYGQGGWFLTIFLMFVGAGAGSTGGGIKVTTFVVLLLGVWSFIRGREDLNIFHRRLEKDMLKKAFCSSALYLIMALTGAFIIMLTQNFDFSKVIFEVASAIGTVGLSSGLTTSMSPLSRVVLVLLMYSGRVGSLSLAMAVTKRVKTEKLRNPEEKIIAG